jgi:hypothetical protein
MLKAALALSALLALGTAAGCGGSRHDPESAIAARFGAAVASSWTTPKHRPWPTQAVGPAMATCKRPVERTTSLSASARREIAEPCEQMDERVHENEAIVRWVCQELASAVSATPNASALKRLEVQCFAEYEKTLPPGVPR